MNGTAMKVSKIVAIQWLVWAMLLFPQIGQSQVTTQRHKPVFGAQDAFSVQSSRLNQEGSWLVGTQLHYAYKPLLMLDENDSVVREVLKAQLFAELGATYSYNQWFEVALAMPFALMQCGQGMPGYDAPASVATGNMRLEVKVRLLGDKNSLLGLAVVPRLSLPTASDDYIGDEHFTFSPRLVMDIKLSRLLLMINFEYTYREDVEIAQTTLDQEFGVQFAAILSVIEKKLEVIAEAGSQTSLSNFYKESSTNAMEAGAGLRIRPWAFSSEVSVLQNIVLSAGMYSGILKGIGTPQWRAITMLAYSPVRFGPMDQDGDGVADKQDACPSIPEDPDGFKDNDGCPDPDNDQDGISDQVDGCPNEKEDVDHFADLDGCPDWDNDLDGISDAFDRAPMLAEDKDGILDQDGIPDQDDDLDRVPDVMDQCKDQAEDIDGFNDQDGCPDVDNDNDGLQDASDLCPLEAEDKDGFHDQDGCPDPDNDGDGINDSDDKCSLIAEDFDGFEDQDGCPEAGKPAERAVIVGKMIQITEKILFATGSARIILSKSGELLADITQVLHDNPWIELIEIQGHTDSRGRDSYNLYLSQKRSESVKAYLESQGIAGSRLQAKGFGETKPIASNASRRGRAANRRVEFAILKGTPPNIVIEKKADEVIKIEAGQAVEQGGQQ